MKSWIDYADLFTYKNCYWINYQYLCLTKKNMANILLCCICPFYCIRCFGGPIQLPSGRFFRGLESQLCGGDSPPKEQRIKLHAYRQQGGRVQQAGPFFHHRRDPGSPSQGWPQRPGRGGGPVQCLLQMGLQQEWDQLPLLRVTSRHILYT